MAKRIIDYECNEAFLIAQNNVDPNAEIKALALDSRRFALYGLEQQHKRVAKICNVYKTNQNRIAQLGRSLLNLRIKQTLSAKRPLTSQSAHLYPDSQQPYEERA